MTFGTRTWLELKVGDNNVSDDHPDSNNAKITTIQIVINIRARHLTWWNNNQEQYSQQLYKLISRNILPQISKNQDDEDNNDNEGNKKGVEKSNNEVKSKTKQNSSTKSGSNKRKKLDTTSVKEISKDGDDENDTKGSLSNTANNIKKNNKQQKKDMSTTHTSTKPSSFSYLISKRQRDHAQHLFSNDLHVVYKIEPLEPTACRNSTTLLFRNRSKHDDSIHDDGNRTKQEANTTTLSKFDSCYKIPFKIWCWCYPYINNNSASIESNHDPPNDKSIQANTAQSDFIPICDLFMENE